METFSHAVVICTRSRKNSLYECLDSLAANKDATHVQLVIVLNGVSEEEFKNLEFEIVNKYKLKITVLHSEPGLTKARNMALSNTRTDLLTFLDDDVILPNDFISKVEQYFREKPQIKGASPRIKNLYQNQSNSRNLLVNRNYGRLTRTSRNYWVPDVEDSPIDRIDWLPGCCMTYRTREIGSERFCSALENGPSGGYALGEDVDFSARIGMLGLIKNVCIEHKQAPSVRDSSKVMSSAIGRWHGFLIRNHPDRVSLSRTITLEIFLLIYLSVKFLACRVNAKSELVHKILEVKSLVSELRTPTLVSKK